MWLAEIDGYDPKTDSTVRLYLSDRAFRSTPTDADPNRPYLARLSMPLSITRSLYQEGQVGGDSEANYGQIRAINRDGRLDAWRRYEVDQRPFRLLYHPTGLVGADQFEECYTGVLKSAQPDLGELAFTVRDPQHKLNEAPVSPRVYRPFPLAVQFNGSVGRVIELPSTAAPYDKYQWTVDFWSRVPPSTTTNRVTFAFGTAASYPNGQIRVLIGQGTSGGYSAVINGTTLSYTARSLGDNQPRHYALSRNGDVFRLYVDDVLVAQQTIASVPVTAADFFVLGSTKDGSGLRDYATAQLWEVRVWDRALSKRRLSEISSTSIDEGEDDLRALYHLSEGVDIEAGLVAINDIYSDLGFAGRSLAFDSGPNGYHGVFFTEGAWVSTGEGTVELEGVRKYLAAGGAFNFEPDLLDGRYQRYAASGGPVSSLAVRHGGVELSPYPRFQCGGATTTAVGSATADYAIGASGKFGVEAILELDVVQADSFLRFEPVSGLENIELRLVPGTLGSGTGQLLCNIVIDTTTQFATLFSLQNLIAGGRYHVSVFFDLAAEAATLYLNRQLVSSQGISQLTGSFPSMGLNLGNYSTQKFQGRIWEVRVWNTVRNAADVKAETFTRIDASTPGLIGLFRCDEGSGTTLTDVINGNDLTITDPEWATAEVNPDVEAGIFDLTFGPTRPIRCDVGPSLPLGHAARFGGTAWAGYGSNSAWEPNGGSQTWEAWVRFHVAAIAAEMILSTKDSAGASTTAGWQFRRRASGVLELVLADGTNNVQASGSLELVSDQWYHLAVVWDDDGEVSLYVDLALDGTASATSVADTAGGDLYLAARGSSGTSPAAMDIVEARVWSEARSLEDLRTWHRKSLLAASIAEAQDLSTLVWYLPRYSPGLEDLSRTRATATITGTVERTDGPAPTAPAECIRWIAAQRGGFTEEEFSALEDYDVAIDHAPVERLFRDESSATAIDALARPHGAWGFTNTGQMWLRQIQFPDVTEVLRFSGSTKVTVSDSAEIRWEGGWLELETLVYWLGPSAVNQYLFLKDRNYYVAIRPEGYLEIRRWSSGPDTRTTESLAAWAIPVQELVHVHVKIPSVGGETIVMLNGVEISNAATPTTTGEGPILTNDLELGTNLNGFLLESRVKVPAGAPRTAAEILETMHYRAGADEGFAAVLPLDDGSGVSPRNLVGLDGAITGAYRWNVRGFPDFPLYRPPAFRLRTSNELAIDPLGIDPPKEEAIVLYRRNWAPYSEDELAPLVTVDPARVEELTQPSKKVRLGSPIPKERNVIPTKSEPIESPFVAREDAQRAARLEVGNFGVKRSRWRVVAKGEFVDDDGLVEGLECRLHDHRFDIPSNGENALIIGGGYNARDDRTELEVLT